MSELWEKIELGLCATIPSFIRYGFELCGFSEAVVFKKVTDTEINMVELFMRNELMTLVLKQKAVALNKGEDESFVEEEDILIDEQQLIEYYGPLYAHQPENFRFQPGHRMLIKEMVLYVANVVDAKGSNSGLSKFKTRKRSKQMSEEKKKKITIRKSSLVNHNPEKLKSDLIQRVISCMDSHRANYEFNLDLENDIHDGVINVLINGGVIHGTIRCIICDKETESKSKSYRVHYSLGSKWPCWVLSNFAKHLKNAHNLKLHERQTELVDIPDKKKNYVSCEEKCDVSIVCLTANSPIKSVDNTELNNAIYTQLSNQVTLMMATILKNVERTENMHFNLDDDLPQQLTVVLIAGNGNCLYSALAHQLENNRINSRSHQAATSKLRADVVRHILENYSKFAHSLHGRIYELKKSNEIDNIDTECKLFVKLVLSKDGTWGGAETINAVAEIKQVNIVLFNENGPCHMLTKTNPNYSRTVCIAYRQARDANGDAIAAVRNHYDSVCDVNSTALWNAAQIIGNKQK